jgi:uncharacterized protein
MKKILITLIAFVSGINLFAQNTQLGCYPYPKTISVIGSAEMEVIPDEIYVQVDLKEYKKKGEDKVELDKIKSDFIANCKAVGIADSNIAVASYDGYSMAAIWRRRRKDPDMMASVIYQIKFNNTKLIDTLVEKLDDQATSNFGIVRTSHSKMREYRKQLKIMAVKAAKEKGQYLTESINEQLGQAITIDEPEESSASDVANGRIKSASNQYAGDFKKEGYYDVDKEYGGDINYKRLRIKYDVKVLFSLK